MEQMIVSIARYIFIFLILVYTWHCFSIFGHSSSKKKKRNLMRQRSIIFLLHLLAYTILFIHEMNLAFIGLYIVQVVFLSATMSIYKWLYPQSSTVVVNNMCMLLVIGFIILGRLDLAITIKQFSIVCGGMLISFVLPIIIRKLKILEKLTYLYAGLGFGLLLIVLIKSNLTNGANIMLQI